MSYNKEKMKMQKAFIMAICKFVHLAVSTIGFVFAWIMFYATKNDFFTTANINHLVLIVYFAVLFFLFHTYDVYNIGYASKTDIVFGQVLSNVISGGIVYFIASILFEHLLNPLPLIVLCLVQGVWNVVWTVVVRKLYDSIYKRKNAVIIYRNNDDLKRLEEIRSLKRKFEIKKYIEDPDDDYHAIEKELEDFEVIIVAGVNASLRNGIAKYCIEKGKLGYFSPHVGDIIMQGSRYISSFSVPIFNIRRASKSPFYIIIKRLFDIVVSFTAIVVLSPIFLLTALAVKIYDRGPVLYKQVRLTKNAKEFKILKFRSMRVDAEKDGVARLASENDDRITPVGKFIRTCRLDELPQLFNILKGDMSIVGPRPERPEIAEEYVDEMSSFSLRLQVKAGLTGFAQVYGKYNTNPYDKLEMDLMYINRMSISEDLRLMFATIRILFLSKSTEGIGDGQTTAIGNNGVDNNSREIKQRQEEISF